MSQASYNNNNLSLFLGVAFAAAVTLGDFKKSNLSVEDYLSTRAKEAVEFVLPTASATAAPVAQVK